MEVTAVRSWINYGTEIVEGPSPSLVGQLVEAGQPFWLDIENPTDEIIDQLAARLGLHPVAVEDSKQFGQRAKLQIYGGVAMMVGFGLDQQMREPVEVHVYYTTGFLITLHRVPSPALDALGQEASVPPMLGTDPVQAAYRLVSALHAPFPAFVHRTVRDYDVYAGRVPGR
jgi:magnesium transporter